MLANIISQQYFIQCLVYIDTNMVRAGVVQYPSDWVHGGYQEIQAPPDRYIIINQKEFFQLAGISTTECFQHAHRDWIC